MPLATHRIRRQRWVCRAHTPEEAFALRGRLREAQEAAIPAVFERVFDAACPGDEVVVLPRLELRVRLTAVDDLTAVLPDLLARALHEQLDGLLAPTPGGAARSEPVSSKTVRESFEQALVAYLTTGALPWELAQTEAAALREQLREIAFEDLAAVLVHAPDARAPLRQQIAFFFRLLQLVPEEKWGEVWEQMILRLPEDLVGEVRRVVAAGEEAAIDRALMELWWRTETVAEIPLPDLPGTASSIPRRSPPTVETPRGASPRRQRRIIEEDGTPGAMDRPSERKILGDRAPSVASGEVSPLRRRPTGRLYSGGSESFDQAAPVSSREIPELDAFPLAIRSAGLVLLHPFLPRLFESAGLTRAGEPGLPWAALPRAAALLHWLATGREGVLEFELGFIKILLGRRPEEPLLVSDDLLASEDRDEGAALLQAAIGHWRALKSTTPAGLRASFLQRGGLLREKETGWHLQVEPAAFDLLLDHLPWGLGVVKLPWMKQPIFTDWPTS